MTDTTAALRLRQFNRFYTRRLGLLDPGHLQSPYSLPEVRVLYELAHRDQPTAREIAAALGMDAGYLSRMLRRLRQLGLVRARTSPHDGRQRWLTLTARGRRAFDDLDARATESVAGLIRHLEPPEQQQLARAVASVEALLDGAPAGGTAGAAGRVELREPVPGDLGWVVQRHGELYSREYGWNGDFERLVARIVGEFAGEPQGVGQRCWIVTVDQRRAGCVFLMPGAEAGTGRLRLLLVEPWARGLGLGTRLVAACIAGAREAGYRRLTLWTNDVLAEARRIYERAGFRLGQSERHRSFGKPLTGQTWELAL